MSQEIKKIVYCPAGHSSNDIVSPSYQNSILSNGNCHLCTKEHFIQEFKTWSSGNADIDEIIQEFPIPIRICEMLRWIPYDNFKNIEHIADGGHGSVYSAKLKNGIKRRWNFNTQDWEYEFIGNGVALKEIKDSRFDIVEFLKVSFTWKKYSSLIDLGLCKLDDLILNSNKNNKISGSIPYVPPEVLRGNEFTREGDIYSFGGIMYEIVTAQQPFADQAHDTYLMMDICNGVRPKVPDFMLNWIPEWYLDLMYRCWSDDPSIRPTATELFDLFWEDANMEDMDNNNNVMRQLKIADENQNSTSESQKQELFKLFSHSSKLHPQSCYISRSIHTLHGLQDLLEEIKSGNSSDPNILKSNESYNIDSKDSLKFIDEEI
ncbi:hypothetical protein Glove_557g1 [Diversispora epigaea]|uniref:Protein kinase domain-containing protein n=1 Tax=Diversispora epigaea TaxID=1348612 RepID=A0A397GJH1_9GLOM|nr:hypothetical protein Glove_557g1 [Diversispora epigaea]